jgi:serine/threonine protein kinase
LVNLVVLIFLDVGDLIASIFKKDPAKRPTILQILEHPWLKKLGEIESTSSTSSTSKLGNTSEEMLLAAKLEACGFNVPQMLHSVHTNACNQLSALWHLLLEKNSGSTSLTTSSSYELHVSDVDEIFEKTHQQPMSNQNPLLQIAASEKPTVPLPVVKAKNMNEKEMVAGRRKKDIAVVQTSGIMSGGLLRISERMKTVGIEEEDEGFLMTPTKTEHS